MLIAARELATAVFADPVWWLSGEWLETRDTNARWALLRKAYSEHDARSVACQFEWDFTPIEEKAWEDIRALGLPLYPQYPAGRRFIDFADPARQIGVEIDGRSYHDLDRDLARDLELQALGWHIFHVAGRNTFRIEADPLPTALEPDKDEHQPPDGALEHRIIRWGMRTSVGFFWALQYVCYQSRSGLYTGAATAILRAHQLRAGTT